MAQYKNIFDNMAAALECGICLNHLENPKTLNCSHSCCKDCIDDMLKFNQDGSATIACPMRCEGGDVFLTKDETTSKLIAPYQLKNILEIVRQENDR